MRWWIRAARLLGRVLFMVFMLIVAASPFPFLPIVFKVKKRRDPEVPTQVAKRN